ncbi:MAG: hypothetical protein A2148_12270 [Chloroflexi bacterium RBG_16_68_14]|nr:MAG: hypothetical protein A2148_12270 [Chloroflexi bacterium RBG_16_68_14]
MKIAVTAGAVLLASLLIAACGVGGGGGGDEGAIEDLMEGFFQSFQDGDAEQLASVFSAECGDMKEAADAAIEELRTVGESVQFDVIGVDIQNLEENAAEVLPEGFVIIDGEKGSLAGEEEEYAQVVKEGGEWKLADCTLFD